MGIAFIYTVLFHLLIEFSKFVYCEKQLHFSNIFLSHGTLTPEFKPTHFSYAVQLEDPLSSIAIIPELDIPLKIRKNTTALPLISYAMQAPKTRVPRFIEHNPMKEITLNQANGKPVVVYLKVSYRTNPTINSLYTLKIQPSTEPNVELINLEGFQDTGDPTLFQPILNGDVYYGYVKPVAETVTLKPQCALENTVKVYPVHKVQGKSYIIRRDRSRYRQIIKISCEQSLKQKNYVIVLMSSFMEEDIPPPRMIITSRGQECSFKQNRGKFTCPSGGLSNYRTQIFSSVDKSIKYVIKSLDKKTQVRLIDDRATVPFTYSSLLPYTVTASSGKYEKNWTVIFTPFKAPAAVRATGWIIGFILSLLLLTLIVVCGLANLVGIGSPIGMSECAFILSLLIQFVTFSTSLQAGSVLNRITKQLQFATMFWLLPWSKEHTGFTTTQPFNLYTAYGCLFWSACLFALLFFVHLIVILKFYFDEGKTYPHGIRLGSWEHKVLYWFCFPGVVASTYILRHPGSTYLWKQSALVSIGIFLLWGTINALRVSSKISSGQITWVWQYPLSEQGETSDAAAGYWSDVVCDQLLTQPVNRSVLGEKFPWQWTAAVADIQPVNICLGMFARGTTESTESFAMFMDAYGDGATPFGAVAKEVDVLQAVAPNAFCPGQRLVCGLFRCDWVDILFTYQALTLFYGARLSEINKHFATIPLTVKTCQLQGPLTGGLYHFFFDGIRRPFLRIVDIYYRVYLGLVMGLMLSEQDSTFMGILYGLSALISFSYALFYFFCRPFIRSYENKMIGVVLISFSSMFLSLYMTSFDSMLHETISQVSMYILMISSGLLLAYCVAIIFLTYSAITCPSFEEVRLLENLANCNVNISDHNEQWVVEVPAYVKRPIKDLNAQCSVGRDNKVRVSVFPSGEEVTLEFSVDEVLMACTTETLPIPFLVLYFPDQNLSLGYRWTNIYDASTAFGQIKTFIEKSKKHKHFAESIAKTLAHQIQSTGNMGKTILSITVIPPEIIRKEIC